MFFLPQTNLWGPKAEPKAQRPTSKGANIFLTPAGKSNIHGVSPNKLGTRQQDCEEIKCEQKRLML